MHTITGAPKQLKLAGAMLAFAAMAIVLIAVALAAGNAQAQTAPYADPKPCGPGQKAVPENPDATITQGHYGIFDGYWNFDKETLNLNLCPPSVKHRMETQEIGGEEVEVEVSTRTASNVDIQKTIIHIDHVDGIDDDEQFKHVLTAADVERYDFFKVGDANNDGVDDAVGTTVWWLKVDDESTPDVDEDSPLAMGFTAALFDSKYWYRKEGGTEVAPLQYEFVFIREPGIPVDEQGHVFAFDDSVPAGDAPKTAFWDSSEVDANTLRLHPGEYHHLQWAFTKPGTYVISVQLKGHVRQYNPHTPGDEGYDADWEPISSKKVETSEVGRYTIHVGPLTLVEQPTFQVERSVRENSPAGTQVGNPVAMHNPSKSALTFTLKGDGAGNFSVSSVDGAAQVKVAAGSDLDYGSRNHYDLRLQVSDGKDRLGNSDPSIDQTLALKIVLEEVNNPRVSISASSLTPKVGETVTFTATTGGLRVSQDAIHYTWAVLETDNTWTTHGHDSDTFTSTYDSVGARGHKVIASWRTGNGSRMRIESELLQVTWSK